jgi:hypothetical protein
VTSWPPTIISHTTNGIHTNNHGLSILQITQVPGQANTEDTPPGHQVADPADPTYSAAKEYHTDLMLLLSGELEVQHIKHLKQVIKMTAPVPKNTLANCNNFLTLAELLER